MERPLKTSRLVPTGLVAHFLGAIAEAVDGAWVHAHHYTADHFVCRCNVRVALAVSEVGAARLPVLASPVGAMASARAAVARLSIAVDVVTDAFFRTKAAALVARALPPTSDE